MSVCNSIPFEIFQVMYLYWLKIESQIYQKISWFFHQSWNLFSNSHIKIEMAMYFSLFTGPRIKMHKIIHYHLSQRWTLLMSCFQSRQCPLHTNVWPGLGCLAGQTCNCMAWGWGQPQDELGQATFGLWVGHACFTLSGCKNDLLNNTQYWILGKSKLYVIYVSV